MPRIHARSDSQFHDALARVVAEQVEFPLGTLVTVLAAHITPDSKHATITLSVLPSGHEDAVLRALRGAEHDLKDALSKELRMRRIPRLHWRFDHTEEEAAKIEESLNDLKRQGDL